MSSSSGELPKGYEVGTCGSLVWVGHDELHMPHPGYKVGSWGRVNQMRAHPRFDPADLAPLGKEPKREKQARSKLFAKQLENFPELLKKFKKHKALIESVSRRKLTIRPKGWEANVAKWKEKLNHIEHVELPRARMGALNEATSSDHSGGEADQNRSVAAKRAVPDTPKRSLRNLPLKGMKV